MDRRVASAFYGGFTDLRPMQKATLEPIAEGQNIVLAAGTGSGKTEAVIAPLVSRFWHQAVQETWLTWLYIVPTRALANDLERRLWLPFQTLGMKVGIRHGDRDDLVRGTVPHLLITTPESLDVMMMRREPALKTLSAVLIDEVHLLYNSQRGMQLAILLQRLKKVIGRDFQWCALSATIGRLEEIPRFFFGNNADAVLLHFSPERKIDAQVRYIPDDDSLLHLAERLTANRPTKALIFADSRRTCDRLASILQRSSNLSSRVFTHYSSLAPELRIETEAAFGRARTAFCVATSTLELGIDIGDIDLVILWGAPRNIESFMQRIGRGNRRSNKTNVLCLIPPDASHAAIEALRFITLLETTQRGDLPKRSAYNLFGAVGQQCLDIIAGRNGSYTQIQELCEMLTPWPSIDRKIVEAILAELGALEYLQRHGFKNRYGAGANLWSLLDYRMIYGNFPIGSQTIDLYFEKKLLGSIPRINVLRLEHGALIQFASKQWEVVKIAPEQIMLQPSKGRRATIELMYGGSAPGFDSFLCDRLWHTIHSDPFPDYWLESKLLDVVYQARAPFTHKGAIGLPFLRSGKDILYFTFGGGLVNRAIGHWSKQQDFQAKELTLQMSSPISWKDIPTKPLDYSPIFPDLLESSSPQTLYQKLLPSDLQLDEQLQPWLRDETIPQVLNRLTNSSLEMISDAKGWFD